MLLGKIGKGLMSHAYAFGKVNCITFLLSIRTAREVVKMSSVLAARKNDRLQRVVGLRTTHFRWVNFSIFKLPVQLGDAIFRDVITEANV